jgi:hypothetical protein
MPEKGRALGSSLFFSAHDSGYHKTPIQISADEVNQHLCAMMLTGEQKPS